MWLASRELPAGAVVRKVTSSRPPPPLSLPPPLCLRPPPCLPAQAPETPPLPPITLHDLESMSAEEKRSALGDRLYVKVYDTTPDNCAKVTGMLLEKDPKDVLMMLNNQALLVNNITEALCVLRDSETRQ
ncbi:hypothetical protein AGDE_12986 [Angomonas deanei]|nr:hypothetical protein AGDE_12986 [Angomonas deanei]|eukprot:EPY23125.1 hypothetical protein AGDE_12986 [Angomonas deanei]